MVDCRINWWQQIRVQKIERDEDIIQYLINMERDFWLNHVEKDEPPMFDGSEGIYSQLLKQLYSESIEDSSISLGKQESYLLKRDQSRPGKSRHYKNKGRGMRTS